MSGLTKKAIYADKVLATLLSVKEGTHVSYAELSKGLHKYIKEKDLKKPSPATQPTTTLTASSPREPAVAQTTAPVTKHCRDCGMEIPSGALFCDLCGVPQ